MDTEYDRKFEEMKQYIPFLESMIKRFTSANATENPCQAQLNKIKSLRDLLVDKKKRMKMANLLKCEQVLINLYAKVEKRDTLPGIVGKKASEVIVDDQQTPQKPELEKVRNKLMTVVRNLNADPDTLPEIARATESDSTCTPGSKEPALFQRRPNRSPTKSEKQRNYTRVLVSPESDETKWKSSNTPRRDPLFVRRSPKSSPHRSPRRRSSSFHKKERKKSNKNDTGSLQFNKLNITLKVPEESLNSLNTKDILSRIINCSDTDVDIDSLRELRSQILGELKQTGANEDISDLILKSYKKGKQRQKTKDEIEEGELSDSESEAIDNIYRSLVVFESDRNKESSANQISSIDKDKESRKIQICLVLNSDAGKNSNSVIKNSVNSSSAPDDSADFEMYDERASDKRTEIKELEKPTSNIIETYSKNISDNEQLPTGHQSKCPIDSEKNVKGNLDDDVAIINTVKDNKNESIDKEDGNEVAFKPNFYKPLSGKETDCNAKESVKSVKNSDDEVKPFVTKSIEEAVSAICKTSENVEIPLLNTEKNKDETPTIHETLPKQHIVSEIDILQALKNEILSENIPLSVNGNDSVAPLLHQPKITKVANAKEINLKKRISIESYKEKVVSAKPITPLFIKESEMPKYTDDCNKKQSLKLTEKECERFNFPAKLALDYSSDEDYKDKPVEDINEDLVPKSPDTDVSLNQHCNMPPVIIPVDPVKTLTVSSKSDVDMRTLPPILSPNIPHPSPVSLETASNVPKLDLQQEKSGNVKPLTDPRLCRDLQQTITYSPNQSNLDRTPLHSNISALAPNMAISMTPNSRPIEITPSHQSSLDLEEDKNSKHVYAPLLSNYEYQDQRETTSVKESKQNMYEHSESRKELLNYRYEEANKDDKYHLNKWNEHDIPRENCSKDRDSFDINSSRLDGPRFGRSDPVGPSTPSHPFGRSDCPLTPNHPFGRSECPPTPSHPFGRADCPPTPSHPFGRSECPSTPSHPFGRSECPPTPSHPFGRADCPPTPSHPFGRPECPSTPSHPFGRSECPPTPSHPFGRLDCATPVHHFGRHESSIAKSYGMIECPTTPIHPFGLSDIPTTPVHSFGRTELPVKSKNHYGRNDYSQNQSNQRYGKDPRLNRSNEYDSNTRRYGKDNRYDRNRSSTNYREINWEVNTDDSYKNEPSNYRSSREKGFDGSNRFYSQETYQSRENRREISIGQNTSDGRYFELCSRLRNDNTKDSNSPRNREHQRRSVTHDNHLRTPRSSSIDRRKYDEKTSTNNTFSVKPHAGRSFTIDTSIKSTFQEPLNKSRNVLVDNTFNARRQRATSVGRTCLREASVSRTMPNKSSYHDERNSNKNDRFRRAASVGRDLSNAKFNQSFKDIKAQFESFKATYDLNAKRQREALETRREINSSRSRSDVYQKEKKRSGYNNTNKYSPKQNIRDPRNRRDYYRIKDEDRQRNKYDRSSYGIVYSNDNIAKGTVFGAASGVKNYKIPKIKRPVEETEIVLPEKSEPSKKTQNDSDNSNDKSSKIVQEGLSCSQINKKSDTSNKNKNEIEKEDLSCTQINKKSDTSNKNKIEKEDQKLKDKVNSNSKREKVETSKVNIQFSPVKDVKVTENVVSEKILTWSSKNKDDESDENYLLRPIKKGKKAAILESESDEDKSDSTNDNNFNISINEANNLRDNLETIPTIPVSDCESQSKMSLPSVTKAMDYTLNKTIDNTFITKIGGTLQSCFNLDDLDVFSDNLGTEPVIDNINALIADLDNDIDTPKDNKNDSFTKEILMENMLDNLTDAENDTVRESPENTTLKVIDEFIKENSLTDDKTHSHEKKVTKTDVSQVNETRKRVINEKTNDSSYSIINKDVQQLDAKENDKKIEEQDLPDSTINSDSIEDSGLTKSSFRHDDNDTSAFTSTIDNVKDAMEPSSSQKEQTHQVDQLDSLLSIFKDKNKLKELLSMLDDKTNENEKIKKKLEKLSAIVSDDEDDLERHDQLSMSEENRFSLNETSTLIKDNQRGYCITKEDMQKNSENVFKINVEATKSISSSNFKQIEEELQLSEKQGNTSEVKGITNLKDQKSNEGMTNDVIDKNDALSLENASDNKSEDSIISKEISETNINFTSNKLKDNATDTVSELTKDNNLKETETRKVTPEIIDIRKQISEVSVIQANNEFKKGDSNNEPNFVSLNHDTVDNKNIESKNVKSYNELSNCNNVEFEDLIKNQVKQNAKEFNLIESVDTDEKNRETNIIRKNNKKGGKGKKSKKQTVTRQKQAIIDKPKKINRELLSLQNDIKEMFISEGVLNNTGIRMCRLAKLTEEKAQKDVAVEDDGSVSTAKTTAQDNLSTLNKSFRKKPGPKPKLKQVIIKNSDNKKSNSFPKSKPGPKSKTKFAQNTSNFDPYVFDTDSNNELKDDISISNHSDSDSDTSSVKSHESTEVVVELKKKKRKHGGWKSGVIKTKKKKKIQSKLESFESVADNTKKVEVLQERLPIITDMYCFTDKYYCFEKNVFNYSCRLCSYSGNEIVHHYKKQHPHTEIPLSRMTSDIANEAIEQCEDSNFAAISKLPTDKYTCRFCFKEFSKKKANLESFFWHIVSMHTGEYKQLCSECVNVKRCPFNLDIPPPPKNVKGQLIGYICAKCNYTQISLENLKTHVIDRHNDEQTEVYTINLSYMSKNTINMLLKLLSENKPRVLRSSRANVTMTEVSDDCSDASEISEEANESEPVSQTFSTKKSIEPSLKTKSRIKSKITFENDDNMSENSLPANTDIKVEQDLDDNKEQEPKHSQTRNEQEESRSDKELDQSQLHQTIFSPNVSDVVKTPHFKVSFTKSGTREYVCCVDKKCFYKTSMTISMKKHVQIGHKEKWDGFCYICEVIVTSQGKHLFKDCFQHFLEKHIDDFEVIESEPQIIDEIPTGQPINIDDVDAQESPTKTYISVRPISDLIATRTVESEIPLPSSIVLPQIQNVMSLGASVNQCQPSPIYPAVTEKKDPPKQYKYEEWQADIMLKKHRVVLDTMMAREKLCHVFKCAGRYCSFSTDSAEDALLHASTHQRVGGEGALNCAYCNFDASGNAIDLVMHVFKNHGGCQYVCGHCFYRAVAGQLVTSHSLKAHPDINGLVLHSTVVVKPPNDDDNNNALSRTDAVPHFICDNIVDNALCKFRTYTPTKFYEHLQQRHENETSYKCYQCQNTFSAATDLVYHMKAHGLKLYQCTWCVYGEDIEEQFLSHASAKHPDKQPQAYLRIITGKDGSLRVLPLAYLNKSSVPSEDVTPGINNENPVKEAERSTELEKLIGHTIMLIEQTTSQKSSVDNDYNFASAKTTSIEQPTDIVPELILQQTEQGPDKSPSRPVTPNNPTLRSILSQQLTPILKTGSNVSEDENRDISNVIYSLDSDDENTSQNIIDLSVDDSSPPEPAVVSVPPEPVIVNTPLASTVVSSPLEPADASSQNGANNDIAPTTSVESEIDILPDETRKCNRCNIYFIDATILAEHVMSCFPYVKNVNSCPNCQQKGGTGSLLNHVKICIAKRFPLFKIKSLLKLYKSRRYICGVCQSFSNNLPDMRNHMKKIHNINKVVVESKSVNPDGSVQYTVYESNKTKQPAKRKLSTGTSKQKRFGPQDIDLLPINPILDELVYCSLCEFNTKVRLNMVRHLQLHAKQQPVPQTAPVNPVPHLETNEMHFDRMINLASSSLVARYSGEKQRPEPMPPILQISPEAASRYPKYVPDRQRHTCGAKGCSYISVDEAMLKHHWEALHTGSTDYRCVHCPAHQQLDKSRTLTSVRIIAHLKMHESNLYGCSICSYYHYKRQIVEKHLKETHKGLGTILIIREESPPPPTDAPATAPTMDLKAWQCGLCDFKSMLRAEVVEHCSKSHQSKMQFKCTYCPFRTSTQENVTKHQSTSHVGMPRDIFYYFYREGDVSDEPDGVPLWSKQRLKAPKNAIDLKPEVDSSLLILAPQVQVNQQPLINLNTVKTEAVDPDTEDCLEDLCNKFGQFCDPNGLKYKCPLCKVVSEDCKEAMQSHLYEELRYRKWACKICSYKAFHKKGLDDHMYSEHRVNAEPIELPVDIKIESWVSKLLEHQEMLIKKSKDNLAKQKIQEIPKSAPTSKIQSTIQTSVPQSTSSELQKAFGNFGDAVNGLYGCPKCDFKTIEESLMQDHLETELTKIRWSCSVCVDKFQNYHEAQFHCKSAHSAGAARPVEARRDPALRVAWRTALVQHQKSQLHLGTNEPKNTEPQQNTDRLASEAPDAENSLLVVRYEERVPIPEGSAAKRKRPASTPVSSDSDDDRLHIDESSNDSFANQQQMAYGHKCPYCVYTTRIRANLSSHVLRHYGLKLYSCGYCNSNSDLKKKLMLHHSEVHKGLEPFVVKNKVPDHPPAGHESANPNEVDVQSLVCLACKKTFTNFDSKLHVCTKNTQRFSAIGKIVVKCGICLDLYSDVKCLYEHHKLAHKDVALKNYSFSKIQPLHKGFIKNKWQNYEIVEIDPNTDARSSLKRMSDDLAILPTPKKVAKKSTTKLPLSNTVAKKSTTKLPLYVYSDSEDEFDSADEKKSYYGTKPVPIEQFEHITTLMPIYNTIKAVTIPKLSRIMEIDPRVVVRDIKNQ